MTLRLKRRSLEDEFEIEPAPPQPDPEYVLSFQVTVVMVGGGQHKHYWLYEFSTADKATAFAESITTEQIGWWVSPTGFERINRQHIVSVDISEKHRQK